MSFCVDGEREAKMIAISLLDGLTCGPNLYRFEQVFRLPADLEADYFSGMNAEKGRQRQKRIFGKQLFRQATAEEILQGLRKAQIKDRDLNHEEKEQVKQLIQTLAQARLKQTEQADADFMDLFEE
jgi:hypothetical protein